MVLGQLMRGCTWRDPANLTKLYKVYVRPHLEYAQSSWSPWLQGDITTLEQVQHRFTRIVSGMGNLTYEERLAKLGLTTLQDRRVRGDMIETFKILTEKVDVNPDTWFTPIGSRKKAASTSTWPEKWQLLKSGRTSSLSMLFQFGILFQMG